MDLQFHGANCVSILAGGVRTVVDDNLEALGGKSVIKPGDVVLFTGPHDDVNVETKLVIDFPGEYEISDLSIQGIAVRAHMDEKDQQTAIMYKIQAKDLDVLILGHIYPELNDDELERIGRVDVLVTPVGGNGYTLDPTGALNVVKKIEPKLVIPTHYADETLNYSVPQQSLEDALKVLVMEQKPATTKLRLKPTELTDVTQLIVLEKS